MHAWWTYLLLRIAYKAVFTDQKAKDIGNALAMLDDGSSHDLSPQGGPGSSGMCFGWSLAPSIVCSLHPSIALMSRRLAELGPYTVNARSLTENTTAVSKVLG